MAEKWVNTSERSFFIDSKSTVGYSYKEVKRVQCPHCKKKYPVVKYITEANYCPNCGKEIER